MNKLPLYAIVVLSIVFASCSKKSAYTPINNGISHYPETRCYIDTVSDIHIPVNVDTTIAVLINVSYQAYRSSKIFVRLDTLQAGITVNPSVDSVLSDTVTNRFSKSFLLHIQEKHDTGVFHIGVFATYADPSTFDVIVHR